MVNTCEPVIKIVTANEPKWLSPRNIVAKQARAKRRSESESGFNGAASWTNDLPVDSRYLPSRILGERNVETPYSSCQRFGAGEWVSRKASRSVCGFGMSEKAKAAL